MVWGGRVYQTSEKLKKSRKSQFRACSTTNDGFNDLLISVLCYEFFDLSEISMLGESQLWPPRRVARTAEPHGSTLRPTRNAVPAVGNPPPVPNERRSKSSISRLFEIAVRLRHLLDDALRCGLGWAHYTACSRPLLSFPPSSSARRLIFLHHPSHPPARRDSLYRQGYFRRKLVLWRETNAHNTRTHGYLR